MSGNGLWLACPAGPIKLPLNSPNMATYLRILFVAPFGIVAKTTVQARLVPLARELTAQGHHVEIVVPPWDSPQHAGQTLELDGVRLVHVEISGGIPAITLRLLHYVERFNPDIVHIAKPRAYAGLVQWFLWQLRHLTHGRRPAIFLDVDDWEQAWAPLNGYPAPVARFLAWQEEWGWRHADGVTAASMWLANHMHRIAPHIPTCYLPNGLPDLPVQSVMKVHQLSPRVLFFTRFIEVPAPWLAAMLAALLQHVPSARLLLAGRAVQPSIESRFRLLFLREVHKWNTSLANVEWLGYVPAENLPHLFAAASCAIFPAEDVPLHQAKCSVRLATTLLHGLPVIASAVGEQLAYGSAGGAMLLPSSATPQQFAEAIATLLNTPEQWIARRTASAPQLAAAYSFAHLGHRLESFYAQIIQSESTTG
jgi:glycosyltransferase involved in cell wall biosynthesis